MTNFQQIKIIKLAGTALALFIMLYGADAAMAQMPRKPYNLVHRRHVITQHFKRMRGTLTTPYTRKKD